MCVNHRAELGKVTPGHISMLIGPMVCCQAGSAQAVQQASVHTSEGGAEKLLALTVPVPLQRAAIGTPPVYQVALHVPFTTINLHCTTYLSILHYTCNWFMKCGMAGKVARGVALVISRCRSEKC